MRVDVNPQGDGIIKVTLTAGNGAIQLVKFGSMLNAHVAVPGTGQTLNSNQEIKPPAGATTFTFDVVVEASVQSGPNPTTTVPFTVFDGCGTAQPWNSFVGGGTNALQSTASISDTSVSEGNTGNTQVSFTVKLTVPSSQPVTYTYNTSSGSAVAPSDFVAATGTVTFNPGEIVKTVVVQARGDFDAESDESFTITLSNPVNGRLNRSTATASIINDDSGPSASGDTYVASVGQQLTVAAPGLLSNDQAGSQTPSVVKFGGIDAGGTVDDNNAGATKILPGGGSLTVRADGSFDFTPPTGAGPTFSFQYRAQSLSGQSVATVIVNIQTGPAANADPNYVATGSTPLSVPDTTGVLANDTRGTPQANVVSFGTASPTTNTVGTALDLGNGGSLNVQGNGSFTFTAPSTVTGPFTFQYRIQNPAGTADATVTITVARGPIITTTAGSTAFSEGSVPVLIDAGLTVTNPSGGNIDSATVVIANAQDGANEALAASVAVPGINANYTPGTHTLSLTGARPAADYQTALRGVTFDNTSQNPNTTARTIQFQAMAGAQTGNQATKTVTVGGVNDAPVLSNIELADLTYPENDPPTVISQTVTINDLDSANLAGATVGITMNCMSPEDVLALNPNPQNGITAVYTPATCTLVMTGSASLANYQAALRSITYVNTSNSPSPLNRTVGMQVTDGTNPSNTVSRGVVIGASNDLPVITTTSGSTPFTEGAAPVVVDSGLTVTDADSPNLASATVTISNLTDAGAEFLAANVAGTAITQNYVPGTGVLTLSGPDTVANFQQVLRTVTYNNSSLAPTTTPARTISFVGNDGTGNGNTATKTVTLSSVNSAPVVTTSAGTTAYTENSSPIPVDVNVTVTDADNLNLASATVTITNIQDAGLETLVASVVGTSITQSYAPGTGILTLTGPDTVANFQLVLRTVAYENTSNNPTAAPDRIIRFEATDGTNPSNQANKTVSVAAANDAPVVTTTAGTTGFTEGAGPVIVDTGVTVTDVDSPNLASVTVTITNLQDGVAESLNATASGSVTVGAPGSTLTLTGPATLANFQAVMQTVTYNNTSNAPNVTDRVISFVANDGTNNSVAANKSVTITTVNSAPTVTTTGGSASYTENNPPVIVDGGVTVTDVDSPNLASATIIITNVQDGASETLDTDLTGLGGIIKGTSSAAGTFTLTLTGPGTVANFQTALQRVTYVNASNAPTTSPDRIISFQVNDGAVMNNLSNTATRNVTVAAANDPPVLANLEVGALTYNEGDPATNVTSAITITDTDSPTLTGGTVQITTNCVPGEDVLALPGSPLNGVTGTYTPATCSLALSGTTTVANYETALRAIQYSNSNVANPNTGARTLTFQVNDGGVANNLSNQPTRGLTVVAVNDAPVLAAIEVSTVAYTENAAATQLTNTITITDVDSPNFAGGTVQITGNCLPGEDVLALPGSPLNGVTGTYTAATCTLALTGNTTRANYETALRAVRYTNSSNNPSTALRTVSFTVNDGGAVNNLSNTLTRTITITAVNDPPAVTPPAAYSVLTNTQRTIADGASDLFEASVITDPDGTAWTLTAETVSSTNAPGANNVVINTNGSFSYDPPAGFTGNDTFTYEICDNGSPAPNACVNVTATMNVAGTAIWYINNNSGACTANCDGRLSHPFDSLADFQAVNNNTGNNPGNNDVIFIYESASVYVGPVTLLAGQRLVGQDASSTLAAISGVSPPAGSLALPTMNATAATATTLTSGGTTVTLGNGNTLRGFTLGSATTSALVGTGIGNLTFADGTTDASDVTINTNGQAMSLNNGTVSGALVSTTSTGGAGNVVLTSIAGTFNLGSGAVSGATATNESLEITNGSATISYSGSITKTTSGGLMNIISRPVASGNITLSGNLSCTSSCGGINVSGNNSGTITFSGATKTLSTGGSTAVSLTTNTGTTINFTGGNLDIDTTSGTGFNATGGGTVTVQGTVNTINSTTGTALNVSNTTIGAADLTFQSISSSGAASGIILSNSGSGDLTVTGNSSGNCGGDVTTTVVPVGPGTVTVTAPVAGDCTGGVILNSTGSGISLTNTASISLTRMRIANSADDGISGSGVGGLTLVSSLIEDNGNAVGDRGIDITELTGTGGMAKTTVRDSKEHNVTIRNDVATSDLTFTVTNSQIATNDLTPGTGTGDDGIQILNTGTSTMNVSVTDSSFTDNKGDHFQAATDSAASTTGTINVTFSRNRLTTTAGNDPQVVGGGITINPGGNAKINFTIDNNQIQEAFDDAINLNLDPSSLSNARLIGTVSDNIIGIVGVPASGSESSNTITIASKGAGTATIAVTNNQIHEWGNQYAIFLGHTEGTGTLNATVTGNTAHATFPNVLLINGIRVDAGATAGPPNDTGLLCAGISGNDVTGEGNATNGDADIRLRQRFGTTIRLPGYSGANNDTAAVNAFVAANNDPPGDVAPTVSSIFNVPGGGGYVGGAACATP